MPKSVKLSDVARAAGVSLGTASQALNQRSNVSAETREKVLEVALSLGYLKDQVKPLYTNQVSVIGMLTKCDANMLDEVNPFFSHIQAGIEQACREYGISLMISSIEVDLSNRPVAFPAMLKEKHPDGLIFISTFLDNTLDDIYKNLDMPIVLADSYAPSLNFDSVLIDNRQGALLAVHHLIQHGHQRIGLIGSNPNSPPQILERRATYLEALQTYGLEPFIADSDLSRQPAYMATQSLINHSQVTAIFACNDDVAIGAMQAVRDLGKRIPEDVSIIGFDNIDSSADVYPALTTVHVPKRWIGIIAVQTLIERARNPEKPKTTTILSTDLIVRQSVSRATSTLLVTPKGGEKAPTAASIHP